MLVLSRKTHESILINDDIEIFVAEIRTDNVKLGIRAPRSVSVWRKELRDGRDPERLDGIKIAWVNIYASRLATFHTSKAEADTCAMRDRVACKKIRYLDGEFDA